MAEIPDPLEHPIAFSIPHRLTAVRNWHEHIPFAFYLVSTLRPGLIVELGTHRGDSYCSFCQAVAELRLPARCFAVDTWQGDEHAGAYGSDVLAELRAHHDPLYGGFSQLLQTTFDDAAGRFEEGSIDLLHIDGYHTYEAVAHDFESWQPKLSPRGIVLLHDTAVRVDGFGVWRLVEELRARFPTIEFVHGHGLAAVLVGESVPQPLRAIAELDPTRLEGFRALFAALGAGVRNAGAMTDAMRPAEATNEALETAVRGLEATIRAQAEQLEERLARVESQTDALVQSRVLRIARGLRGISA